MNALRLCMLILTVTIFAACRVSDTLQPSGDTATIDFRNGVSVTAELLFLKDSTLYVVPEPAKAFPRRQIYGVPFREISSVEVEGYANRKWETSMLAFQIVPTALFVIAAANADQQNIIPAAVMFGLPTILVYAIFEVSTPDAPSVEAPVRDETVQALRKHLKFPGGLTDDQLRAILAQYQQDDIEEFPWHGR